MDFEQAREYSFLVPWEATECFSGSECWCRIIVPIEYRNKFVNQGLVGFRVEYLNSDGTKIPNFFRIITSSFYCEPVVQNLTNTVQKSIRYRYVEGATNLMFCTLSPSSSPTNKPAESCTTKSAITAMAAISTSSAITT